LISVSDEIPALEPEPWGYSDGNTYAVAVNRPAHECRINERWLTVAITPTYGRSPHKPNLRVPSSAPADISQSFVAILTNPDPILIGAESVG
jgi:hypothetical protein